ncbi:AI-2E family transporter [Companilactobacillus sp. RD055328]|uniref:AI-2E family transporter n=1 Tax=Companilactobacillus sp. RD055328 TaxID=2916634 RepID=UPI001FC87B6C|nr:AI-2E family transporter [Companilactobacillus sp. RD055328]GKQ43229.1 AI-2E family transporter [Companilactobacillus sp. RD055328]
MYEKFIANQRLRRNTVLLTTIFVLFLFRGMMNTLLLTFILTFLMVKMVRRVQKIINIKPIWIIIPVYVLIIYLVYLAATLYVPQLATQVVKMFQSLTEFYNDPSLQKSKMFSYVMEWVDQVNLDGQIKMATSQALKYIGNIGEVGMTIFISFILSFFYSFDLDNIDRFGDAFLKSRYSWLFKDLKFYADKFVNTFGVVLEAQLFIAFTNTIITGITLVFMNMPSILALSVMVFLLSLIPVAGVVISLVPLSMVAYSVGGIKDVIYIIIMIIVIHAFETYFLNPKFMSSKTHLPMFFTFVVLIVAEKFMGAWGLIVGIPIFTFLLDILDVKVKPQDKKLPIKLNRKKKSS